MSLIKSSSRGKVVAAFDLKATLAEREGDFKRQRAGRTAAGESESYTKGSASSSSLSAWAKDAKKAATNRGVAARAAKDRLRGHERRTGTEPSDEYIREMLTKKAKIAEQLERGETAGLTQAQRDALSVDYATKFYEHSSEDEDDDSDDADRLDQDESRSVPQAPGVEPQTDDPYDPDPFVEYEDELGRTRRARRSKVPQFKQAIVDEVGPAEENIYYGDIQQYPVYEQTEEEYRRRIANLGTDAPLASALNSHYKADKEQRDRGAAFVNFSQHADTRAEQQAAMRDIHRTAEVEKEKRRLAEEEEAQQVDAKALEGRRRVDEAKARKEAARKRALARAGGEPPSKVVRPDLT